MALREFSRFERLSRMTQVAAALGVLLLEGAIYKRRPQKLFIATIVVGITFFLLGAWWRFIVSPYPPGPKKWGSWGANRHLGEVVGPPLLWIGASAIALGVLGIALRVLV